MCTITSNEQEKTEAHAAAGMPASDKVESHNALFQSLALHAMLAMLFQGCPCAQRRSAAMPTTPTVDAFLGARAMTYVKYIYE